MNDRYVVTATGQSIGVFIKGAGSTAGLPREIRCQNRDPLPALAHYGYLPTGGNRPALRVMCAY
jgi:hypothetical protein